MRVSRDGDEGGDMGKGRVFRDLSYDPDEPLQPFRRAAPPPPHQLTYASNGEALSSPCNQELSRVINTATHLMKKIFKLDQSLHPGQVPRRPGKRSAHSTPPRFEAKAWWHWHVELLVGFLKP